MEKFDSNKPVQRSQILKATTWNIIAVLFRDGFRFIVRLILVRLILPEEFGLIGMAVVFTGLVETINELGLGAALIQRKESNLKEIHFNTAFWSTIIFNAISFLVMGLLIAPLVSNFYNEPLLKLIIIILCIPILLKPLALIHRVKLIRDIHFKPIAIIESIGSVVAGISGIIMALFGMGIWSIAFQGTVAALVTIPLMWIVKPWVPSRSFLWEAFKDIFNFGFFVLVKKLIVFFVGNIDYLIIGKLMGSYFVGIYTLAFTLTDIFRRQLMSIVNKVMFPVYSKVQHDPSLAGRYYLKVVKYNSLLIFPIMACMFAYANAFIILFFGEKWSEAILPLQMLSIAVMLHVATGSLSTVLSGMGKVKVDFTIYIIKTFVIIVPSLLIMINYWGIIGAGVAILVSKALSLIINIILAHRYVSVNKCEMIKTVIPATMGSLVIIAISFLLRVAWKYPDNIWLLASYAFVGLIAYAITVYPFIKNEIKGVINNAKE